VVGEVVKAFVALKPGFAAGDALNRELLAFVRKRLGAAVAPKEIAFVAAYEKLKQAMQLADGQFVTFAQTVGYPQA
ncbi:MAG TPA: hypothetical protein VMM15_07215, partial [Bradyrhizobium sp.]|nr:hypothetical protein [Bradyrhizobium sp.]